MKRAQSLLEIALLLCFVVTISFAVISMFNNQKIKLADMSKSTIPVNLKTANGDTLKEPIVNSSFNKIETAGTNALEFLNTTANNYETTMAKITFAQLKQFTTGGEDDIFKLANDLNNSLNLGNKPVFPERVTTDTLSIFTKILNAAVAAVESNDSAITQDVKDKANSYITQVKSLLGLTS